jgi:hypothetical protein
VNLVNLHGDFIPIGRVSSLLGLRKQKALLDQKRERRNIAFQMGLEHHERSKRKDFMFN